MHDFCGVPNEIHARDLARAMMLESGMNEYVFDIPQI